MPRNAFQTLNAQRIARHRERRRQGKVHLAFDLDPWSISGLIAGGWLDRGRRFDAAAVGAAFVNFVTASLDTRRHPHPGR
jgi:hypothetical protein